MKLIVLYLKYFRNFFLIFIITFVLALITDFVLGNLILKKLNNYFATTEFYGRLIRINHDYYHHGLKPNVQYKKEKSFNKFYTFCTDNNGFKYKCNKKRSKSFDYAFIGDSFTEGVALKYEDTFVGIFEKEKNISVANLAVTSYSPSIYLAKTKYLLDNGYNFKHLVVFLDISDLYDDSVFYKLNEDGSVGEKNAKQKKLKLRSFLRKHFPVTNYYFYIIKMNSRINKSVPPVKSEIPIFDKKSLLKAKWTYQKSDFIEGYNEKISVTKKRMIKSMSELHSLLKKNNIKLSVVVYPWPQQIQNDVINSQHVNMWQHFCISKCENFINFFPKFFKEKNETSYLQVYKKYYFWNDVHFNSLGNKFIADNLLDIF